MLEDAFAGEELYFRFQLEALLEKFLFILCNLVRSFVFGHAHIGLTSLLALLEDAQILKRLLAQCICRLCILTVHFLQRLLVIRFADLPCEPRSELYICGVHPHKYFLEVTSLVLTCLVLEEQAKTGEVLHTANYERFGLCTVELDVVENTVDIFKLHVEKVQFELLHLTQLFLPTVRLDQLSMAQKSALAIVRGKVQCLVVQIDSFHDS